MRIYLLLFGSILLAGLTWACRPSVNCKMPSGTWTNREGRDLIFTTEGSVLMLDRFGSQSDTVPYILSMNCQEQPMAFDLSPKVATVVGPARVLYGIMEWSSDTSFRIRQEIGSSPSERPTVFDAEQTQVFYRK